MLIKVILGGVNTMNEQELKQTIDELKKLTQQRDEINKQIEKIKMNLIKKQIKEKMDRIRYEVKE